MADMDAQLAVLYTGAEPGNAVALAATANEACTPSAQ
jgi:hypothetical protein